MARHISFTHDCVEPLDKRGTCLAGAVLQACYADWLTSEMWQIIRKNVLPVGEMGACEAQLEQEEYGNYYAGCNQVSSVPHLMALNRTAMSLKGSCSCSCSRCISAATSNASASPSSAPCAQTDAQLRAGILSAQSTRAAAKHTPTSTKVPTSPRQSLQATSEMQKLAAAAATSWQNHMLTCILPVKSLLTQRPYGDGPAPSLVVGAQALGHDARLRSLQRSFGRLQNGRSRPANALASVVAGRSSSK